MPYRIVPLVAWIVVLFVPACVQAQLPGVQGQFSGSFANDKRFSELQIVGGLEGQGPLRLKGPGPQGREVGPLLDPRNPVDWFADERSDAPPAARACVELIGGDRLPGQVVGYRYGTELPLERQYPHLLVKIDPDAVRSPQPVVRVPGPGRAQGRLATAPQ